MASYLMAEPVVGRVTLDCSETPRRVAFLLRAGGLE
jgi:hypothetical protein